MKVTPELLKKYANDQCTPEEKAFLESWIPGNEDILVKMLPEKVAMYRLREWNRLQLQIKGQGRVIPLYKKITRYATAACIAIVFFGAGYLYKGNTSQIAQKELKEKQGIIVYGENGNSGSILGESFKLNFDGALKLFNNSNSVKTIVVGEMTYVLEPQKTYFITGNISSSSLMTISDNYKDRISLKGYFGIIKS